MAVCASCGAALAPDVAFCGNCGKAVGTASPAPQASAAGGAGAARTPLAANVAGALAYVLGFITGILFLVLEPYKNNRFIRFHAMQSILFSAAVVAFSILWVILWGILFDISISLALVAVPLRLLISLAIFAYWLFLMYQAYSQREYRIPFIGDIAAKQVG
jgi:uncharacterized membrane protein